MTEATTKRSINDFLEELDHKFKDVFPLTGHYGFKLDEQRGIKQYCGKQSLKSVDYLVSNEEKHHFVEFSDIGRQIDAMFNEIAAIRELPELDKNFKKRLFKNIKSSVNNEARDKYKDTCTIFFHIDDCLSDAPSIPKGCKFVIVYSPLDGHLKNSKIEIVKFIDMMKTNLTTSLPDDMCHGVQIIPIDVYAISKITT